MRTTTFAVVAGKTVVRRKRMRRNKPPKEVVESLLRNFFVRRKLGVSWTLEPEPSKA